ncbi:MAG: hypothetical protein HGA38_01045 [Candidatus Moranbacteria bacterium]|nr:hypothetical protein [Candidatus Moranbacteria bacterium]NTW45599.1 hypothetical protein [Candidatus Moranbacteria bacterium]
MEVSDPRYDDRDKTYRTPTVFGSERVGKVTVIPAFFPNEGHDVGMKLMLCYMMALDVADKHGSESVVLPDTYGADGSSCGALWDAVCAFLSGKRARLRVIHICCLGRPRSFEYFRERLLDDTVR